MFPPNSNTATVPARAELRRLSSPTGGTKYSLRFIETSATGLGSLPRGLSSDEPIPVNEPILAQQLGYTVRATSAEGYGLCLLMLDSSLPVHVSTGCIAKQVIVHG